MSEWPAQPRLTEALHHRADEAATTPAARMAALASLRLETTGAGSQPPSRRVGRSTRGLAAVAAAAVVCAALGVLVMSLGGDHDQPVVTDDVSVVDDPEFVPPVDSGTVAPLETAGFGPGVFCDQPSGIMTFDYAIGGQVTEVWVAKRSTLDPNGIALFLTEIGGTPAIRAAMESMDSMGGLHAVVIELPERLTPDDVAWLSETVSTTCTSADVVIDVTGHGSRLECRSPGITGPHAYVLVDPGPPPTACRFARPTVLVTTGGADPSAWAGNHGCVRPTVQAGAEGETLTTYGECDSTLLVVEPGADPLLSTIDGVPALDFYLTIRSVPK